MTKSRSRRAPTREERKARTRNELIDAAERLFRRDGFHATSLDLIADEAGYTRGAVYSNFAGKEDLFFAVYERRVAARVTDLEEIIRRAASPAAAIRAISESVRDRAEEGWMAVFFEFWAHVLRNPGHRERFASLHRQVLEPTIRMIGSVAHEQGAEPPCPPELIATVYHALGNGLQLELLTRPGEVDAEAVAELVASQITPLTQGGRR